MIKILIWLALIVLTLGLALDVFACYTQTLIIDGRIINCTTCGNVTNCF